MRVGQGKKREKMSVRLDATHKTRIRQKIHIPPLPSTPSLTENPRRVSFSVFQVGGKAGNPCETSDDETTRGRVETPRLPTGMRRDNRRRADREDNDFKVLTEDMAIAVSFFSLMIDKGYGRVKL